MESNHSATCFDLPETCRGGLVRLVGNLVILLSIVTMGCDTSPPLFPVSGQVLIDGSPATTGSIRFVPEDGRPATSSIDDSGRFRLTSHVIGKQEEGVLPGVYRVAVTSNEIIDDETARWLAPAKYADFRTSGLEVNVEGPLKDVKIELTWEGVEDPDRETVVDDAPAQRNEQNADTALPATEAAESEAN